MHIAYTYILIFVSVKWWFFNRISSRVFINYVLLLLRIFFILGLSKEKMKTMPKQQQQNIEHCKRFHVGFVSNIHKQYTLYIVVIKKNFLFLSFWRKLHVTHINFLFSSLFQQFTSKIESTTGFYPAFKASMVYRWEYYLPFFYKF